MTHEDPLLLSAFYGLAAAHPQHLFTVTSGDRSQQPASSQYPIAPEGTSNHERWAYHRLLDEAIDVVVDNRPISGAFPAVDLAAHGLQTPVRNDPVHLTRLGWNG